MNKILVLSVTSFVSLTVEHYVNFTLRPHFFHSQNKFSIVTFLKRSFHNIKNLCLLNLSKKVVSHMDVLATLIYIALSIWLLGYIIFRIVAPKQSTRRKVKYIIFLKKLETKLTFF